MMDTLPKTIMFISRIIYPKYNPIWFILYMYFKYFTIVKRQKKFAVVITTEDLLWNIIRHHPKKCCDINNSVIVHPDDIYPSDNILLMSHADADSLRKVFVVPDALCRRNKLLISITFFNNAFAKTRQDFDLKLNKSTTREVQFAQEIELSLIATPYDISNALIDKIVEAYFTLPKIVYKNDIISINIKYFAPAVYYAEPKVNGMERVYFKCNKIICQDSEVQGGCLCVIGKTSIKQNANIQSFVPTICSEGTRAVKRGEKKFSFVWICPDGLEEYFDKLDDAIHPFLNTEKLNLRPIFLIQGKEGCGKEMLVRLLASKSGMHYYRINNSDLVASVYAQNESKLNNVFFTAKMSAPCIVSIHKFHNFGKNNDGQYDQRLINSFIQSLSNLFENNPFPVILFCCSDSKDIPAELKRVFLEILEIKAPIDTEREEILKWILKKNDIEFEGVDLKSITNKTNGFYFEDLKALVYYAENNFHRRLNDGIDKIVLTDEDFQLAIDFMQSNYNESLGAPKVPKVQWSDVGGLDDVKEDIIQAINLPLKHPELFKNSGLSQSGILLFGPPGTGKTLIAKAVATECSLCFLTVKGPELLNMYVGQSEQNVREVFERARQASPCIIFFDELDSLAPNRGLSGDSGGVMDRVVSQLLAEMDGLESSGKVFIIGATNRPDLIDPALLRPGRFDKLLYVGPCTDLDSKISVIQALTRKFKLADDVILKDIVKTCPANITGADFYGICANAWSSASKRLIEKVEKEDLNFETVTHEDVVVTREDFNSAIKNVKPSISERDLKYFENLKKELSSNVLGNR